MKTFLGIIAYVLLMGLMSYEMFGPENLSDLHIDPNTVRSVVLEGESLHRLPKFEDDDTEVQCLAENIYHEARNQGIEGMTAVAAVTLNRMHAVDYPNTVCEVVYQPYQFSWTFYGMEVDINNALDATAWEVSQSIAKKVLNQGVPYEMIGVYFYHADYVNPQWALTKLRHVRIGNHIFYKNTI